LLYTVQLWSIKAGWGSRPDIHIEKGHTDDITGLKFSTDGLIVLSRSMDSTLKVVNQWHQFTFYSIDFLLYSGVLLVRWLPSFRIILVWLKD